jgi:hypothetical protein
MNITCPRSPAEAAAGIAAIYVSPAAYVAAFGRARVTLLNATATVVKGFVRPPNEVAAVAPSSGWLSAIGNPNGAAPLPSPSPPVNFSSAAVVPTLA